MIVMSTHDFNHPLLLEDDGAAVRMALMENGSLSAASAPAELLSSGAPESVYGIKSRLLTVEDGRTMHYLAAWTDDDRREI